jgi:flagellar hook-basal body complex protein FliE
MPGPITPISGISIPDFISRTAASGGAFQDALTSAINKVESIGKDATSSVEHFLSGEGEDLHTAVLATQRADLAFEMFLQVRNKVVSAYQEIMKMQM